MARGPKRPGHDGKGVATGENLDKAISGVGSIARQSGGVGGFASKSGVGTRGKQRNVQ